MRFDEPELTSDAGLAAVVGSGAGAGLVASLGRAVRDRRRKPTHGAGQIIAQRVHAIMAGYHAAADCDHLRDDPVGISQPGDETCFSITISP